MDKFWNVVLDSYYRRNKKEYKNMEKDKATKHTTDKYVDENVYIPTESYGWCKSQRCMVEGYLADGYCIKCWDKTDRTLHL